MSLVVYRMELNQPTDTGSAGEGGQIHGFIHLPIASIEDTPTTASTSNLGSGAFSSTRLHLVVNQNEPRTAE